MRQRLAWAVMLGALGGACARSEPDVHETQAALDALAERYVKLVLAVGRHDPGYVDAYYGPAPWRESAETEPPLPLERLGGEAERLLEAIRAAPPSPRRDFLERQLVAVAAYIRRLEGAGMPLEEEARLLFDIAPPRRDLDSLERAREALDGLLAGAGDLTSRVERFREQFYVPQDRLPPVIEAVLEQTRRWTLRHVSLPPGERFRYALVQGKPWSAYHWYQGQLQSLIEINTDLPIELAPILQTLAHEGYPGHHTFNVLLEDRLVRGRGWLEYTVYPLYSPQSLLAEGTADAGLDLVASRDEQWRFIEEQLAPLAGLEGRDFSRYRAVLEALRPLRYAREIAAHQLLDGGRPEEEVVGFLQRYALVSEARARKHVDFIRAYRAYVFNYTVGEDLVRAWLGQGSERVERFFDLLAAPRVPSQLAP